MNKIISFSLWGNKPKYCVGAVRNAELVKIIYPDWKCRFYVANNVPNGIIFQLEDLDAEVIIVDELLDWKSYFWRYRVINEADVVLVRDCDSRLNLREKACVDDWLKSEYLFHTIKDHPAHESVFVMPGLIGFKKSDFDWEKMLNDFFKSFQEYIQIQVLNKSSGYNGVWINAHIDPLDPEAFYGADYCLFNQTKSLIENKLLVYGCFESCNKLVPIKRQGLEFCGKVYDDQENTVLEHEEKLAIWLKEGGRNE